MITEVFMPKKEKARLSLKEILTSFDVENPKKVEIDPQLKGIIKGYYQETESFFDRAPTDLQNQIAPLQKEIVLVQKEIEEVNKKLTFSYHAEKEQIIGGVVCYVHDQKTIDKIYKSLRKQKSLLKKKIIKIKRQIIKFKKQYKDYEDMIVEELQQIRQVKKKLKKQGAECIAVLPTRVLTELTKECGLYTFKNIKEGGEIRLHHVGFTEADEKMSDNNNLFRICPKNIKEVNANKKKVFIEKVGDIFPSNFSDWVLNPMWGFFAILIALGIGLGFGLLHAGFKSIKLDASVSFISLVVLSLGWMVVCIGWMLWRYYAGYPAQINLSPAPKSTQERLIKCKKIGYKIYLIVEEEAFSVSLSTKLKVIEKPMPLPKTDPILVADDGNCSIVIDQYGNFPFERQMVDKIIKMYCPEHIIGSYRLN